MSDSPFVFASIDASEIGGHASLVGDLIEGRAVGAVVRGALPADAVERAVARFAADDASRRASPHFYVGHRHGPILVVSPSLDAYLADAEAFAATLRAAFEPFDIVAHFAALLGALSGRPARPALSATGRSYSPVSLRVLGEGGSIDIHCENETTEFPPMAELKKRLDLRAQLSFYVPLRIPEEGGELVVYRAKHGTPEGEPPTRMGRKPGEAAHAYLESRGALTVRPGVGDLLIFDSGRHYHRVSQVRGPVPRWTIGGFLALERGGAQVAFWS